MLQLVRSSGLSGLVLLIFSTITLNAQPITTGTFLGADNNYLFYRMVGTGPETVVFLHGGPGFDMADGGYELDALGLNYRLIAYDQRGGGNSQLISDPQLLAYDRHVEDLEALRIHFGIDKLTLIGQSWGSGLAMLYAMAYPQNVERMVMLSPLPIRNTMFGYRSFLQGKIFDPGLLARFIEILGIDQYQLTDQEVVDLCEEYIPIILSPYFTPATDLNNLQGDNCGAPPSGMRPRFFLNAVIFGSIWGWDWRDEATQISAPVLVLDGDWTSVPKNTTREWAYYFPNARNQFISDAGHLTYLDNPEELVFVLEQFLGGSWPVGSSVVGPKELDLVAHYPMDGDALNASDTAQHATVQNTVSYTDGRNNQPNSAAYFGQGAVARVSDPGWAPEPDHWSWSTWVWINSSDDRTLLEMGPAKLWLDHRVPTFTLGSTEINTSTSLIKEQWHHLVVVRDGDTVRLYQDGLLAGQATSATLPALSGDFTFSNEKDRLDDLYIYARSLNQNDVNLLLQP